MFLQKVTATMLFLIDIYLQASLAQVVTVTKTALRAGLVTDAGAQARGSRQREQRP